MNEQFTTMIVPFLKYLDGQTLEEDSNLRELGLDSMHEIELLFAVEDTFGIQIPDELLVDSTFETAGALWSVIEKLSPSRSDFEPSSREQER